MDVSEPSRRHHEYRRSTTVAIVACAVVALLVAGLGSYGSHHFSRWLLRVKLSLHKLAVESAAGTLTVHQVLEEDDPRIRVIVSVVDDGGEPLTNLERRDISLHQEGRRRDDFELAPVGNEPISVVLALDVSESMGRPPRKFHLTKQAARTFIDMSSERAEISLFSFGGSVREVAGFTGNKDELRQRVEQLRTSGTTALFECIAEAGLAMRSRQGRKAIVILTDGYNTSRASSRAEAIATCRGASVPVFCVGLGHEIDKTVLAEIAQQTRGHFFLAPTPAELHSLYQNIARRLGRQVAIVFDSRVAPPSARWLWLLLSFLAVLLGCAIFFLFRSRFSRPCFIVLSGADEGKRLPFPRRRVFTVGRSPACAVQLRHEDGVAEEQCTLERIAWGEYRLSLCPAGKPLLVNGAATEEAVLHSGDVVKLGRLRLMLFIYGTEGRSADDGDGPRDGRAEGGHLDDGGQEDFDKTAVLPERVSSSERAGAWWLHPNDQRCGTLPLTGDSYLVGKARSCDLRFPQEDIAEEQARIVRAGDRWTVEQLAGDVQTMVNGEVLPNGQSRQLEEGDTLAFGTVEYVFSRRRPAAVRSADVDKHFCTQCGRELRPTSKFCPACGEKIRM